MTFTVIYLLQMLYVVKIRRILRRSPPHAPPVSLNQRFCETGGGIGLNQRFSPNAIGDWAPEGDTSTNLVAKPTRPTRFAKSKI